MNKYAKESRRAQRRAKELKGCGSKAIFGTEKEAFQKNQTAYKCKYCGKWHRSGQFTKLVRTARS